MTEGEEDGMGKGERGNVEKRTTRRREKTTTKIRVREKPKKGLAAFGRKLWLKKPISSFPPCLSLLPLATIGTYSVLVFWACLDS